MCTPPRVLVTARLEVGLDAGQPLHQGAVRGDERIGRAAVEANRDASQPIHAPEDRVPVEVLSAVIGARRGLGTCAPQCCTRGNDAGHAVPPDVAGEQKCPEAAHRPPEQPNSRPCWQARSTERQGDQLLADHGAAVAAVASRMPVAVAAVDGDQREARGGHGIGIAQVECRVCVAAASVQHHDEASRGPRVRYGEPPARVVQPEAAVEDAIAHGNPLGCGVAGSEADGNGRNRTERQCRSQR